MKANASRVFEDSGHGGDDDADEPEGEDTGLYGQ